MFTEQDVRAQVNMPRLDTVINNAGGAGELQRRLGDIIDTVGERYFVREAQVYTLAK